MQMPLCGSVPVKRWFDTPSAMDCRREPRFSSFVNPEPCRFFCRTQFVDRRDDASDNRHPHAMLSGDVRTAHVF
jgi:hypothetical protein